MQDNLLNSILILGYKNNATDIHISDNSKILFRIKKELKNLYTEKLKEEEILDIVNTILTKKEIELLFKNRNFDTSIYLENIAFFRIHIYFKNNKISFAVRILSNKIPDLEEMTFYNVIKDFLKLKSGLFLITGSTGSGKSTTLASIIEYVNKNYNKHIVTIEDPIEYYYENKNSLISQKQIGQDINNYNEAITSALREDPDIIVLGELRDAKTIFTALEAAQTGHIIFSTLHTNCAYKTIDRIINSFNENDKNIIKNNLSSTLYGVVSQKIIYGIDEKVVVASEVMIVNNAISNLMREDKINQINNVIQTSKKEGMYLIERELVNLYNKNLINKEDICLYSEDKNLLKEYLKYI